MIDYEIFEMFSELNKTLKRFDTDAQSQTIVQVGIDAVSICWQNSI